MSFETNWLEWPFERSSRQFRTYVVEPKVYAPETHSGVFDAVLRDFFDTATGQVAAAEVMSGIREPVDADLIVFPEAFMAANDLIRAILGFADLGLQCCVHVGLRPDSASANHLFNTGDITNLLQALKANPSVVQSDLNAFEAWFGKQKPNGRFNIGCMFMAQTAGGVRVCLHPKSVRAGIEYNGLADTHMTEANLLTLVTLVPPNRRYLSVTIQPLLCSDVLSLPTDSMTPNPIRAFADSSAANFPKLPADHIDIVSLALCTPVAEFGSGGRRARRWKPEFEASFLEAVKRDECFRHHFASFVMANFDEISGKRGGLSGACLPVHFNPSSYPDGISFWSYGKHYAETLDEWKCVSGSASEKNEPTNTALGKGHRPNLLCLDSNSDEIHIARALGFTLPRLVRDNPVGGMFPGLTKVEVRSVRDETGEIQYSS